mgnify:CR=1 FL=1
MPEVCQRARVVMYNRIIIQLVYTTRSILTSRDPILFSGMDAFRGTAATFIIPTFRFEISRDRAVFRRDWDAKSDKRRENACLERVTHV